MKSSPKNVLVALMNNHEDFAIARKELWYRIPKEKAPPIIRNNEAKLIAFYHTKAFVKEKFAIHWFAEIHNISLVKRKHLFPKLTGDPKAENDYYKIDFFPLQKLIIPIVSLRPRWVLFIPTTEEKFFSAKEINFLFSTSSLEDKFWNAMLRKNIYSERQYYYSVKKNNFFLDFAIFCKTGNIDVEVDGDKYHMPEDAVRNDKNRNNLLASEGWSVLRFTNDRIENDLSNSVNIVMETVKRYGGVQDAKDPGSYKYLGGE